MTEQKNIADTPKEEEKKTAPETVAAAPAMEAPSSTSALTAYKAAHNGKGPPSTRGEKLFNVLDYYGIGFGVNAVISLFLGDKFKNAEWRPQYNKMVKKMGENTTDFVTLSSGGFLLMIPIKMMEDHKEWWARKLDGLFGDKHPSPQQAQAIEARYEEIRQEPKQTYLSEFGSRILAFTMNLGIIKAMMWEKNALSCVGIPFEGLEKTSAKLTERNLEYLHNAEARPYIAEKTAQLESHLAKAPKAAAEKMAADGMVDDEFNKMTGQERMKSLLMLAYLEAACTFCASTLQFGWSRILGPIMGKKPPQEKEVSISAPPPASTTSSASSPRDQHSVPFNGMVIDVPTTKVTESRVDNATKKMADKHKKPSPEAIASHAERISSGEPVAETAR